jgi:enoyl-CoA hydratase/carnithine racemase
MNSTVLTSDAESVRTITLNRPERLNALNDQLLSDFKRELLQANDDATVEVILLHGAGRAFCSGDDLKDFDKQIDSPDASRRFVEAIQDISRAIVLGPKIVVGAIHGWAVGGGLEWVVNCDISVLGQGTRCFFPELKWGMFPTGGVTSLLPRLIGLQKTRELMLIGAQFTAEEALRMGLATRVVPDDEVLSVAGDLARHIASLPKLSVRLLKRTLLLAGTCDFEKTLGLETDATIECFLDPATRERVNTFKA